MSGASVECTIGGHTPLPPSPAPVICGLISVPASVLRTGSRTSSSSGSEQWHDCVRVGGAVTSSAVLMFVVGVDVGVEDLRDVFDLRRKRPLMGW